MQQLNIVGFTSRYCCLHMETASCWPQVSSSPAVRVTGHNKLEPRVDWMQSPSILITLVIPLPAANRSNELRGPKMFEAPIVHAQPLRRWRHRCRAFATDAHTMRQYNIKRRRSATQRRSGWHWNCAQDHRKNSISNCSQYLNGVYCTCLIKTYPSLNSITHTVEHLIAYNTSKQMYSKIT